MNETKNTHKLIDPTNGQMTDAILMGSQEMANLLEGHALALRESESGPEVRNLAAINLERLAEDIRTRKVIVTR